LGGARGRAQPFATAAGNSSEGPAGTGKRINFWLVVWNMSLVFPYIGNVIIPTDELIFFRGVGQPPTSQKTWQWFKKHGNG
jgi:hypothetical protein